MRVTDIMTASPEVVNAETSLKDAASRMKALNIGVMPVNSGDQLQGVITDRDIAIRAVAEGKDPEKTTVEEVLSPGVAYCYDDQELGEAAAVMKEKKIRRLVVLNRDKRMVGICSLGDIVAGGEDVQMGGEALHEISKPAEPER